jgi:hypothetical protein
MINSWSVSISKCYITDMKMFLLCSFEGHYPDIATVFVVVASAQLARFLFAVGFLEFQDPLVHLQAAF